jgi:NADH-quinone oxidoreductase subunit J
MEFKVFVFWVLAVVLGRLEPARHHREEHGARGALSGARILQRGGRLDAAAGEFLAIALVLVYVGAVTVLFLFVLMMLDINFDKMREGFRSHCRSGSPSG